MKRHFLIPVTVAALVHGALLAIPGGEAPVRIKEIVREPPKEADRPTLELVAELPGPTPDAGEAGAAPEPVPSLPEPRVFDDPSGPHIAVRLDSPTRAELGPIDRIPSQPFSWGGGGGSGTGFGGIFDAVTLDRNPNARVQSAPQYPYAARANGAEGEVMVEFVVDEHGRVSGARVVRSTDPIFDEAALRAVAKWRFEPGTVAGRPVRFRMAIPIVFRLDR